MALSEHPPGGRQRVIGARRPLTSRQAQVLELVAAGLSDKEIAGSLQLSVATVRSHLQRLYQEQGFRNRAEAAAGWTAAQRRLVALSEPAPPARPGPWSIASWLRPAVATLAVAALVAVVVLTQPWPLFVARGNAARLASGTRQTAEATRLTQPPATTHARDSASPPTVSQSQASPPPLASSAAQAGAPKVATLAPAAPVVWTELATGQLALVNQDRASASTPLLQLTPLHWNACLASAASQVVQGLVARGYLGATRGVALDLACGVGAAPAETTAYWSTIDDARLNAIFMNDPVERARILGPYRDLGAAWARGPNGVAFLVVEFA